MGCDPSLNGFAVSLPNGQCFTVGSAHSAAAWRRFGWGRLARIRQGLDFLIGRTEPDLLVVEKLVTSGPGDVTMLAYAHGIAREVAAARGVPIAEVMPSTAKRYATGSGSADKALMVVEANRFRGEWGPVEDDNQADATWFRLMGEHWANGTTVSPEHAARRDCIFGPWKKTAGAQWPEK